MLDPTPRTQSQISNPNFPNEGGLLQFRGDDNNPNQESGMGSDNSGVNSPPLWKNSPSPSHPLLDCSSLSPNSRSQAIARGRWELMEMVKNMPESSYELSLKDLVEHHSSSATAVEQSQKEDQVIKVMKRQESRKAVMKFEDKGLFLNVVFPFSIKSRKKDKLNSNPDGKVSSRRDGEKDWWKKNKFTGSSDSDSSRTTTTSATSSSSAGHTGRRTRNGFLTGCWPFFQTRKSKHP